MTGPDASEATPSALGRASAAILTVVILLLGLFPPEARGESLGACALAMALAALLIWPRRGSAGTLAAVVVLGLAIPPLWSTATSPGVAMSPLLVLYLAVAAIALAATVRPSLHRGPSLPAAMTVAGSVAAIHAVWQALWGLDRAAARVLEAGSIPDREAILARLEAGRAFAGFATPAALGGYLALTIPVTVALAVGTGRRSVRVPLVVASVLQVAGLFATSSFTAVAALLGAITVVAATRPGFRRVLLPAAAGVALLAIATVWIRGSEIVDLDHRNNPLVLRAGNMRIAARMVADHPLRGLGPGGYGEAYPSYRGDTDNASRHAHNVPLEWIAEYGIPAGGVLGAVFLIGFGAVPWRRSRPSGAWVRGAEVGLLAFALQNLVDFTALMPSVLWTAAILRGAVAAGGAEARARRTAMGAAAAAVVMLVAVVAALHGAAWNARYAARALLSAGDRAHGEALAQRAVDLAPWDADARQLLLSTQLVAASGEASLGWLSGHALPEADRLVKGVPLRPSARALRATIREATGDRAGAYADLAFAANAYPRSERYRDERDRVFDVVSGAGGDRP